MDVAPASASNETGLSGQWEDEMILGVQDMVDATLHYCGDYVSADGGWWILLLDTILLIPLIFAAYFYPVPVLTAVGAALVAVLVIVGIVLALQRGQVDVGRR
jgi:hypothetical protein